MSMIGKTLAHYEIISQFGKGGAGEVYQAKDRSDLPASLESGSKKLSAADLQCPRQLHLASMKLFKRV
jgi:hypothetical protein